MTKKAATKTTLNNEAWEWLFEKHKIMKKIKTRGFYEITADEIKKSGREPRLMAKWDSSERLPEVLKKNQVNILPISRGSYVLGQFNLYESIPNLEERRTDMNRAYIPELETVDIYNITSEANAINVLLLSNILEDFLDEGKTLHTFNGRMGTGKFTFKIPNENSKNNTQRIKVENAQCEIDGGFENKHSVIIMEAKNVIHRDFHVRQLYYPFRLWKNKVNKNIRLVFSIYSNRIFRLLEYCFEDVEDFSSIRLLREVNYSLEDTHISEKELMEVYQKTTVKTNDNMDNTDVPFIQADSFERVISMLETLGEERKTVEEIAELMEFHERQSDYYYNAGRYLDLFQKIRLDDEEKNKMIYIGLTDRGKEIYKMPYKERQLALVEQILEHQIFYDFFPEILVQGKSPEKSEIIEKMLEYNIWKEGETLSRRASTVKRWLQWILSLTEK